MRVAPAQTYATNAYTPNEASLLLRPLRDQRTGKRAIIALHGRSADAYQWHPGGTPHGAHAWALAEAGYWVMSPTAAGGETWNNAAAMTAITAAYDWLIAAGIAGTKVGLMGWSMGGGNALQWMKENAAKVSAALLWTPMSDLPYFYGDGVGGYAPDIEAAYDGDYATNSVGRRISDEYATWRDKAPIHIYHGNADATIPLSRSTNFVAGVAQAQVTVTQLAGADHDDLFADVPVEDTVGFFAGAAW